MNLSATPTATSRSLGRPATGFVSLEGADHLLTGRNQARRAARLISAWADPYLD